MKTKQRVRSKVWWPGIDREVEQRCKVCHGCQIVSGKPCPEPMKRTVLSEEPWQDVAADLLGPLPGGEYLFVAVNYYSRYLEIEILKTVLSRDIVDSLDHIFARHGIPVSMKTDNGPQFISSEFKNYMTTNGVQHVTCVHSFVALRKWRSRETNVAEKDTLMKQKGKVYADRTDKDERQTRKSRQETLCL